MAGAGTIVLDEVAALSPATQSKLLRVLDERQFERLGGTETITIAARLVALTNSDLARLVADGQFREDLFFRLSVLTIPVPALRAPVPRTFCRWPACCWSARRGCMAAWVLSFPSLLKKCWPPIRGRETYAS